MTVSRLLSYSTKSCDYLCHCRLLDLKTASFMLSIAKCKFLTLMPLSLIIFVLKKRHKKFNWCKSLSVCSRNGTHWRLSGGTRGGCHSLDVPFDCFCRTWLRSSPLCAMATTRRSADTGDPLDAQTCQDVFEARDKNTKVLSINKLCVPHKE